MSDEHLTDEVLSAVLDGEATPAEARHAGSCAMCGLRLSELQRAASLIGSPVDPVDPTRRDAAIAAAIGARVVPIESRRRVPTWVLGAAALVVAVLALVPLVVRSGDDDDADVATSARSDEREAGDTAAGATAAALPVTLGELGEVDADEVADTVRAALSPPEGAAGGQTELAAPSTASDDAGGDPPCSAELAASTPGLGDLRATGTAEVDGRAASVLAYASADGRIRVLVVAVDACEDVLLSATFPAPQP